MTSTLRENSISGSFPWRGVIGGLLGGIIGIAILHSYEARSLRAAIFYWALLAMIRTLPFTIVGGIIVGAIVLVVTRSLETGKVAGAIIGASIAAIIGGVIGAILNQFIIDESSRILWESFLVRYGAIAGAVTGIISGAQDHKKRK